MKIESVDIDKVIPYNNNPRDNDDAIEPTAQSIRQFGWQQPIVLDENNVIIAGHTRYLAAQSLGLKKVPVLYAKHEDGTNLTKEEADAYRLADNKTGELAQWDFEKLNDELDSIEHIDMTGLGFDDADMHIAENWDDDGSLDDYEEPKQSEPKTLTCPHCGYKGDNTMFK